MAHNYLNYWIPQQQVRFLDIWEPAVLAIKREGYSIKCNGQRGVVITEKFQQGTAVCHYFFNILYFMNCNAVYSFVLILQ